MAPTLHDRIAQARERLIAAGHANVEVFLYDAGHGFNCDQRADYDAASAALAKQRTLKLFRDNRG